MVETELPERGVVFWPVGTGDSTTIVLGGDLVLQVDLRDMKAADEKGAVVAAVIDRLADTLPRPNWLDGKTPYLAVFALTHADLDHCCGFGDLLDSGILIGEIWATPRLWREISEDTTMCEDAHFQDEVERRVAATLEALENGEEPASGDRVRIIGYDDDRDQHSYSELPDEYFTFPGKTITMIDGNDLSETFEAFVHAPFKGDCAGERNETSLALQIRMHTGDGTTAGCSSSATSPTPRSRRSSTTASTSGNTDRVEWDVLLSPHHCSKKAMYAEGEDGEEEPKQDILDQFQMLCQPGRAGDRQFAALPGPRTRRATTRPICWPVTPTRRSPCCRCCARGSTPPRTSPGRWYSPWSPSSGSNSSMSPSWRASPW